MTAQGNKPADDTTGRAPEDDLILTRVFDAPRELVFAAWTNPKHLPHWWGPAGFTNPRCEVDVRPGGALRIDMRGPDGTVYPMAGLFLEIVPPERLVFTSAALDAAGNPLFEVLNTVTFLEEGGKTTLTNRARILRRTEGAEQYLKGMKEGWTQSLERLAQYVAREEGPRMVHIVRSFDAPRELVFKAWSDVEHLERWFAPKGCTTTFKKLEFRQGGTYHSVVRTPDGKDCWCKGVYREIVPSQRIVYTSVLTDEQGGAVDSAQAGKEADWPPATVVTITFDEHRGKTTVTLQQSVLESVAKRTGAYPSWLEMLDRLAEEVARAR